MKAGQTRGARLVDAAGAAREDEGVGVSKLIGRRIPVHKLTVDAEVAQAAGNQLCGLGAEIKDDNSVMGGGHESGVGASHWLEKDERRPLYSSEPLFASLAFGMGVVHVFARFMKSRMNSDTVGRTAARPSPWTAVRQPAVGADRPAACSL